MTIHYHRRHTEECDARWFINSGEQHTLRSCGMATRCDISRAAFVGAVVMPVNTSHKVYRWFGMANTIVYVTIASTAWHHRQYTVVTLATISCYHCQHIYAFIDIRHHILYHGNVYQRQHRFIMAAPSYNTHIVAHTGRRRYGNRVYQHGIVVKHCAGNTYRSHWLLRVR